MHANIRHLCPYNRSKGVLLGYQHFAKYLLLFGSAKERKSIKDRKKAYVCACRCRKGSWLQGSMPLPCRAGELSDRKGNKKMRGGQRWPFRRAHAKQADTPKFMHAHTRDTHTRRFTPPTFSRTNTHTPSHNWSLSHPHTYWQSWACTQIIYSTLRSHSIKFT